MRTQTELPFDVAPDRLHGRKGQELMLSVLRDGPLSTEKAEADVGVHRGQQAIGVLRKAGIEIITQRIGGVLCYVLVDPNATLVKVSKTIQQLYYESPHWQKMKSARREFDNQQCVQCQSKEDLEVHHLEYNLFAEDIVNDLQTLCGPCHRMIHLYVKGSSIRFPQFVAPELLARLQKCTENVEKQPESDGCMRQTVSGGAK